ncbi:hypothetical protein KIL84_009172 [Mauremys mutica]|uniref:Uncharacterized protein n=1 Tax=Mauremys mutica TaxID=74926 RepID=A0A9D3XIT5_9SAUR|nr:hypothetical protein KIL84_009172 [Mauremys mutica]
MVALPPCRSYIDKNSSKRRNRKVKSHTESPVAVVGLEPRSHNPDSLSPDRCASPDRLRTNSQAKHYPSKERFEGLLHVLFLCNRRSLDSNLSSLLWLLRGQAGIVSLFAKLLT